MLNPEYLATLIRFRQELYDSLGQRQDSLFELVDAALTAPHRSTLVRLSLTAAFRRLWSSTCDALADGSVDVTVLRDLFAKCRQCSGGPGPEVRAALDQTWIVAWGVRVTLWVQRRLLLNDLAQMGDSLVARCVGLICEAIHCSKSSRVRTPCFRTAR